MSNLFDSSAIIALSERKSLDKLLGGWTIDLSLYEVGNAVWKQVYLHKTLTSEEGKIVLDALAGVVKSLRKAPIEDPLHVLEIAAGEGLTYYDAAYIHAAIRSGKVLVTDDDRLYTAAKKYIDTVTSNKI